MLAVELTSLARKHLPHQLWRRVHVMALPLYVFATIHYLSAGTDAASPMSIGAIGVATASVAILFTRRMQEMRARQARDAARPRRVAAAAGADAVAARDRVAAVNRRPQNIGRR